ncbi:hypothetical protein PENTCL1PPCAC_24940, partial [Pristionchus entomophagus]
MDCHSSLPWFSPFLVSPLLSLLLLPMIACLMTTNKRLRIFKKHSFCDSLKLFFTKSFLLMVIGQTFGVLTSEFGTFWSPSFLLSAWKYAPSIFLGLSYSSVITINSFVSLTGSIIGLPIVMWLAHSWNFGTGIMKNRKNERSFPLVVCIGSISSVVAYLVVLLTTGRNIFISSIALFLTGLCSAGK